MENGNEEIFQKSDVHNKIGWPTTTPEGGRPMDRPDNGFKKIKKIKRNKKKMGNSIIIMIIITIIKFHTQI